MPLKFSSSELNDGKFRQQKRRQAQSNIFTLLQWKSINKKYEFLPVVPAPHIAAQYNVNNLTQLVKNRCSLN